MQNNLTLTMQPSSRFVYNLVRWMIFVILITAVITPHHLAAQDGIEDTTEYAATTVPTMDFIPPSDANKLEDFLPAGVVLHQLSTPDQATFSNSLSENTLADSPTEGEVTTPILSENDAYSFMNDQVAVVVEEKTFSGDTFLQFSPIETTFSFPTAQNPQTIRSAQPLIRFQVEAISAATNQPHNSFEQPARLVIDLRQIAQDLNLSGYNFYLAYRDESNPNRWIDVPIRVHQVDGLFSAEVTHFSEWAAGARPERWGLTWNPPGVSEFSGAVTYQYPIQIPPGRNGLQPGIALSYSSASLNGRIFDDEKVEVADGWSLADISIARVGVQYDRVLINTTWEILVIHPDKFRLVFNGTGHELVPDGPTTGNTVRYYAKDAPQLRIYRYFDVTAPNREKLYWVVETGDGSSYRLGYHAEAEEWQYMAPWRLQLTGHPGLTGDAESNGASAIAWHVDTVTDGSGNQMQYNYRTRETEEEEVITLHKTRIYEIRYNYNLRYTGSLPVPATVTRPGDVAGNNPLTIIQFRNPSDDLEEYATSPITNIYIFHSDLGTPMREYRITAENRDNYPIGCQDVDTSHVRTTRVITQIQEWVKVDNNPTTTDSGVGYTLPATTFTYDDLPHFHHNSEECFQFEYMVGYNNGYGGTVSFVYEHDGDGDDNRGRAVGSYERLGSWLYRFPNVGYSYHVKQIIINDGRNPNVVTDYTYSSPCYGQGSENLAGNWGVMAGAARCWTNDSPEYGGVTGFKNVTITSKDYQGNPVNVRKLQFYIMPNELTGKNEWSHVYKANGTTLMQESSTLYQTFAVGPTSFTPAIRTINAQYHNGVGTPYLSTKTEYSYDTAFQGGAQYGHVTHIREYSDANSATPYRLTTNQYYPNTTSWIVNKTAVSSLYSGNGTTLWNTTYNYYDNATATTTPPAQQGRLTRTAQAWPVSCAVVPGGGGAGCTNARATIEQTFAYGSYGNQTQTKVYADYGYRTFDANWNLLVTILPTQDQQTDILYESAHHLYPIRVTNDLGQQTNFQIYGFNGSDLEGFQLQRGLLRAVISPNGTETRYEYDPFGRLFAIYDSYSFSGFGDTDPFNGDPATRYRYWDNKWNHATSIWLNPAANQPFAISEHNRPNIFNGQNGQPMFRVFTYFDGMGRPIQTQNRGVSIDGASGVWDAVNLTSYNAQGLADCTSTTYGKTHVADSHTLAFDTTFTCATYNPTLTTYDFIGRPLSVTSPGGNTTTFGYGITDHITVDGVNKLSRVQTFDAKGQVVNRFSNSLGQLALVRDFSGTTSPYTWYSDTRYTYDLLGNLTHVTTSNPSDSQPTSWLRQVVMTYNKIGRKISMQDPDMGDWFYIYDALGNLTRQTDEKGQVVCFYYDNLNRLLRQVQDSTPANECPTYASSPASGSYHLASYTYDTANAPYGVGQVAQVSWGASPEENKDVFSYNNYGLVASQTRTLDSRAYTMTTLTWDSLYRPLTVRTPHDNEVITLTYDHEGENSLLAGSTTLVSDVRYNARHQMTTLVRGGFTTTYSYYAPSGNSSTGNNDTRLQTIQHGMLYDSLPNFTYTYDRTGNIANLVTQLTNGTSDTQTFAYDHLHRLDSASSTGNISGVTAYNHDYQYDKLGNILSMGNGSYSYTPSQYSHSQPHAVKSITRFGGTDSFVYDANGNMTNRTMAGVTYTQQFDVLNRLTLVTQNNNNTSTEFSYGAGELRTRSMVTVPNVSRVITYYPFPNYEEELRQIWVACADDCAEEQGPGAWVTSVTVKRSTYHLAGQAIATRISGDPVSGNNGVFYLVSDHLGSTSLMTNSSGAVVANSAAYYLPFGDYRKTPTADLTELGFTGHHENRELGLTYMNARFYLPGIGRFASADTIVPGPENPQAYNRYSYTLNNPILLVDPSGHAQCHSLEGTCYAEEATPITQTEYEDAIIRQHKEANKAGSYSQAPIINLWDDVLQEYFAANGYDYFRHSQNYSVGDRYYDWEAITPFNVIWCLDGPSPASCMYNDLDWKPIDEAEIVNVAHILLGDDPQMLTPYTFISQDGFHAYPSQRKGDRFVSGPTFHLMVQFITEDVEVDGKNIPIAVTGIKVSLIYWEGPIDAHSQGQWRTIEEKLFEQ